MTVRDAFLRNRFVRIFANISTNTRPVCSTQIWSISGKGLLFRVFLRQHSIGGVVQSVGAANSNRKVASLTPTLA